MVGLLEVVARLEVLSEEERRRASREEWKRVEEAGWEVVRRAEGVEVKKEKKEEEEENRKRRKRRRRGGSEDGESGMVEVSRIVRKRAGDERGQLCSPSKTRNWIRCPSAKRARRRRWLFRKGSKCAEAVVARCWKRMQTTFLVSKVSKTGFSDCCKSCHDARYGKKDDFPMAISDARASVDRF